MMRTVEGKPIKNITSLNQFEDQKVGNSTNYSYNKEQLAQNTTLHKRINSMTQSLNKILPNSIENKVWEDAEVLYKEEIREEKRKLTELMEPIK